MTRPNGRPPAYPELESIAWLRQQLAIGRTILTISIIVGCSANRVRAAYERHGLPLPPPGSLPRYGGRHDDAEHPLHETRSIMASCRHCRWLGFVTLVRWSKYDGWLVEPDPKLRYNAQTRRLEHVPCGEPLILSAFRAVGAG